MIFLTDTDLSKAKRVLVERLTRETQGFSHLFCNPRDFHQWIRGMTGEAIAKGLAEISSFHPNRGDFIQWCYLKARKLAERDLRSQQRYSKLRERLEEESDICHFAEQIHQDPFAHYLLSDDLYEVLDMLTRDQKRVLSLVYLVGFSPEEAALILKRKRNAVDALVHRAKQKAREFYRLRMQAEKEKTDPTPTPPSSSSTPKPRSALSDDDDEPDSLPSGQWGTT